MPRFKMTMISAALLAIAVPASAGPKLGLATDKAVYVSHQPVLLEMRQLPEGDAGVLGSKPLEMGDFVLEITPPDGKTYAYRPPMTLCRFRPEPPTKGRSAHHTLVFGGGRVVTAEPGAYWLRLLDARGGPVSSPLRFDVVEPSHPEDVKALKAIARDPAAYGFFLYLEGGDHLGPALDIFEELAAGNSSFGGVANAVLALNFSQGMPMGRDGKPRGPDPAKTERHFLGAVDQVADGLKGKLINRVTRRLGKQNLPPAMLAKLQEAKRQWGGKPEASRNEEIKQALEL